MANFSRSGTCLVGVLYNRIREEFTAIMLRDDAGWHNYRLVGRNLKGEVSSGAFNLSPPNRSSLDYDTIRRHGWLLGLFRGRAYRHSEDLLREVSAEHGVERDMWSGGEADPLEYGSDDDDLDVEDGADF